MKDKDNVAIGESPLEKNYRYVGFVLKILLDLLLINSTAGRTSSGGNAQLTELTFFSFPNLYSWGIVRK